MYKRAHSLNSPGFTIVETLIFLGVTAVMLVSALLLVGGQQRKTEFTQSVRDIESQIKDIANDVSTGYYSRSASFTCKDAPVKSTLDISPDPSGSNIGTNSDCVFLGRAIQFRVSGTDSEGFALYNIAGLRTATDLASAKVTALAPTNSGEPRIANVDSKKLLYGLKVGKITNSIGTSISGFAFVSGLGVSPGAVSSGTIPVSVIPVGSTELDQKDFAAAIDGIGSTSAPGEIKICLISGGTDQHAILTISSNGSFDTNVEIKSGTAC